METHQKLTKSQIFHLKQSIYKYQYQKKLYQKKNHEKNCKDNECENQAYFGVEGNKPVYCATHCSEGMINVISKGCEHNQCRKHASFGFKRNKPA